MLIDNVKEKAVRGFAFNGIYLIVIQLLGVLRIFLIGRYIAPQIMGIYGVALLSVNVSQILTELGLKKALISYNGNDNEKLLNMAFTLTVFKGAFTTGIIILFSGLIADFFGKPESQSIIIGLSILAVIGSFENIGLTHLNKQLDFKKITLLKISAALVEFAVFIMIVVVYRSVWAVVFGRILGTFSSVLGSYIVSSFKPKLLLSFSEIKYLVGYGKWILGTSVAIFLLNQGDDVVVGKILGVTALGLYQMAYKLSCLGATQFVAGITTIALPAYSKLQNQPRKLRNTYLNILSVTSFIGFLFCALLIGTGPLLIERFFSADWLELIWPVRILALWGAIRSLGATAGPLFEAVGKPDIVTKLTYIKVIILVIVIFPLISQYQLNGACLAVVISALVINPITSYLAAKEIKCQMSEYLMRIIIPAIAGIIALLVMLGSAKVCINIREGYIVVVIVGIVFYLLCVYVLGITVKYSFFSPIKLIYNVIKSKNV